jgi:hypothetical protein
MARFLSFSPLYVIQKHPIYFDLQYVTFLRLKESGTPHAYPVAERVDPHPKSPLTWPSPLYPTMHSACA